jgi:hypothetical protein
MANPTNPPSTINACMNNSLLSEEALLNCVLEKPVIKVGNHSYSSSKAGTSPIPYDPELIEIVSLAVFVSMHEHYVGGDSKSQNTLPPLDQRNPLFSESDDRANLTNKVYLPLSRVLEPKGIVFGQDSAFIHRKGSEDSDSVWSAMTNPVAWQCCK